MGSDTGSGSAAPQDAPARLNQLLAGDNPGLDRVLAVIASVDQAERPSEDAIVSAIDKLAADLEPDSSSDATPESILAYVYGDLGFAGDTVDYYNPANSLIHQVLERRRGIPMTLAVVAAEIARRHRVDLRLVGLPGHILLGTSGNSSSPASAPDSPNRAPDTEGGALDMWFDPFSGGARLGFDDCKLLFARFHPIEAFQPAMLAPINAEMISIRMLNNLRVAYAKRGEMARTIPVLEMRAEMVSAQAGDRLELAQVLAALGRYDRAADEFERLAELDPERAEVYASKARSYRAHRN